MTVKSSSAPLGGAVIKTNRRISELNGWVELWLVYYVGFMQLVARKLTVQLVVRRKMVLLENDSVRRKFIFKRLIIFTRIENSGRFPPLSSSLLSINQAVGKLT